MSRLRTARGFSLLEMGIILAIVGMMSGYALSYDNSSRRTQDCLLSTKAQLATVQAALDRFLAQRQHLPLPGPRNTGVNNPAYGHEVTVGTDPSIDRYAGPPAVLFGGVPFATLGLTPDNVIDCWGNQLTYAVTETLTNVSSYANSANVGGIDIRNGTLIAYSDITTQAAYVVVSHGADALGASPRNYQGAKKNCNTDEANFGVTRIDKENCDTNNNIFFSSDYDPGSKSDRFFDDIIAYAPKSPLQVVTTSTANGACAPGSSITWGGNCAAPALLTLNGLSVNLTNVNSGYTGVAVSTCVNGVRSTLGVCLPLGTCSTTNPRLGGNLQMLTGVSMSFGTGVCKKYNCCSGSLTITAISPVCPLIDTVGLATCP